MSDQHKSELMTVTVQLDICEFRPKVVTKDEGVLVHYQSRINVRLRGIFQGTFLRRLKDERALIVAQRTCDYED